MTDNTNEHRLPPPAFPPGQRRHAHRNSTSAPASTPAATDDGLISPDDPIPARVDPIEQAFISPDEPIPERVIELAPDFQEFAQPTPDDGEGEAVGMDLDAEAEPIEVLVAHDPHVAELVAAVARLADALERKGEAGLRTSPEMSRFDATLRAYCVGYLAGRRAEEPEPPTVAEEY